MKRLFCVCLLLTACATPQRQVEEAASLCTTAGFQPGTADHRNCTVQLYAQTVSQRDAQRKALIGGASAAYLLQQQQTRQAPEVTCFRNGPWTTCQ